MVLVQHTSVWLVLVVLLLTLSSEMLSTVSDRISDDRLLPVGVTDGDLFTQYNRLS